MSLSSRVESNNEKKRDLGDPEGGTPLEPSMHSLKVCSAAERRENSFLFFKNALSRMSEWRSSKDLCDSKGRAPLESARLLEERVVAPVALQLVLNRRVHLHLQQSFFGFKINFSSFQMNGVQV